MMIIMAMTTLRLTIFVDKEGWLVFVCGGEGGGLVGRERWFVF